MGIFFFLIAWIFMYWNCCLYWLNGARICIWYMVKIYNKFVNNKSLINQYKMHNIHKRWYCLVYNQLCIGITTTAMETKWQAYHMFFMFNGRLFFMPMVSWLHVLEIQALFKCSIKITWHIHSWGVITLWVCKWQGNKLEWSPGV